MMQFVRGMIAPPEKRRIDVVDWSVVSLLCGELVSMSSWMKMFCMSVAADRLVRSWPSGKPVEGNLKPKVLSPKRICSTSWYTDLDTRRMARWDDAQCGDGGN